MNLAIHISKEFEVPTAQQCSEWLVQTRFILSKPLCDFLHWPFAPSTPTLRLERERYQYSDSLTLAQQAFIVLEMIKQEKTVSDC